MDVKPIAAAYPKPTPAPVAADKETKKKNGEDSKVTQLNADIKQAEAEIKETLKEVQKAVEESNGGSSEKAQLLQSKILMQQQEITMKQVELKEIESPEKSTTKNISENIKTYSRFDEFIASKDNAEEADNVYRLEEKDGTRKIIFNRPKYQESTNLFDNQQSD